MPTLIAGISKLPDGHFIEILTCKKDRSIKIVKTGANDLLVIQNGFEQSRFEVSANKLKKVLKTLLKKEFPRSNKAHLRTGTHNE